MSSSSQTPPFAQVRSSASLHSLDRVEGAGDLGRKLRRKKLRRKLKKFASNWVLHAVLAVFLWMFVGTIVYRYGMDNWSDAAAFYFAAQAGLSVGFGVDTYNLYQNGPYADNGVKAFTVFFVLLGSSGVAAALAVFVEGVIEKQDEYFEDELGATSKRRSRKGNTSRIQGFLDASVLIYKNHTTALWSMIIFCLYIMVGMIFAMTYEDMNFVTALLFSVAALSTGGLIAPSSREGSMWFTGFYVLTGVPLYAFCLGQLAGLIVERHARQKFKKQLKKKITMAEFSFAADLNPYSEGREESDEIDFTEFLMMSLLRMGKVDKSQLLRIRERFDMLDIDGDHKFSRTELQVSLAFDQVDHDRSGSIDLDEFIHLCVILQADLQLKLFNSIDEIHKIFNDADRDAQRRASIMPEEAGKEEAMKGPSLDAATLRVAGKKAKKALAASGEAPVVLDDGAGLLSREEVFHWWQSLDLQKIEKDTSGEAGMALNKMHQKWTSSSSRRKSSLFGSQADYSDSDSDGDDNGMPSTSLFPVPKEEDEQDDAVEAGKSQEQLLSRPRPMRQQASASSNRESIELNGDDAQATDGDRE